MMGAWLLSAITGCGGPEKSTPATEDPPSTKEAHVTVRVEPARSGAVVETVEGVGRCEALPNQLATLTPAVEGHVHQLLVNQGDRVKKGQPIVELDRAVAQADLAEKSAAVDGLKASLALLKSLPRPDERRATELAIEQAKLAVERTKRIADRLRPLLARHEIAEMQLYEADQAVAQARLQQATAEAQLKVQMIGPRPEAVAEAEARIKTAEGLVEFSRAHLDFHTIRSPIDGVLDSLTCHPGQTISIGTPVGEVVETRQVFASVWLPPRSAVSVRVGQPARVQPAETHSPAPAAATAEHAAISGRVAFVGRVADPQTGNLPIRTLVDNPDGRLTIGQTIDVTIVVAERTGVLQVPAAAILDLGEGPVLTVIRDGKSVVLHPQVGEIHQGWVAVSGTDLKEGEPVIVEGGYNLPDGTPVAVRQERAVARAEAPR
jgi:RND family efflux transporter MFP subunit